MKDVDSKKFIIMSKEGHQLVRNFFKMYQKKFTIQKNLKLKM
jgi:hypothetical protein